MRALTDLSGLRRLLDVRLIQERDNRILLFRCEFRFICHGTPSLAKRTSQDSTHFQRVEASTDERTRTAPHDSDEPPPWSHVVKSTFPIH